MRQSFSGLDYVPMCHPLYRLLKVNYSITIPVSRNDDIIVHSKCYNQTFVIWWSISWIDGLWRLGYYGPYHLLYISWPWQIVKIIFTTKCVHFWMHRFDMGDRCEISIDRRCIDCHCVCLLNPKCVTSLLMMDHIIYFYVKE